MRSVVSHPEADAELEAAARYYDERSPGLGDDFLNEFEATLRRILEAPDRWRVVRGDNRKLSFIGSLTPSFTASAARWCASKR